MLKSALIWVFVVVLCCIFCASCAHYSEEQAWLERAKVMDEVAKTLEEYGSATISSPLLSKPDDRFSFNLARGTDKYFEDAKKDLQGASASFEQSAQGFSLGISAQLDPTVMAAYADKIWQYQNDQARISQKRDLVDGAARMEYLAAVQAAVKETDPQKQAKGLADAERTYADKLSPPSTTAPTFPTAATNGSETPAAATGLVKQPGDATKVLAQDRFTGFQGLLSAAPASTISNHSAIMTAASDQTLENIFRIIGKPQDAQVFKDKSILYGVMMVSVDPGWRTQKGFAADLSVLSKYEYKPARREVIERLLQDSNLTTGIREKIANDSNIRLPKEISDTIKKCKDAKEVDKEQLDEIKKSMNKASKEYSEAKKEVDNVITKYGEDKYKKCIDQSPKPKKSQTAKLDSTCANITRIVSLFANTTSAYRMNKKKFEETSKQDDDYNSCKVAGYGTYSSSVIPGWINCDNRCDNKKQPRPLVAAVSPMMETENLDLASSQRHQYSLALSLSAALRYSGLGAQAEAFEQFAKSMQSDVHTRTARAAVNSYSNSGGMFGFQIGPKLQALANPTGKEADAGIILERQTFPTLVIFGTNTESLRPRIKISYSKFVENDFIDLPSFVAKMSNPPKSDLISTFLKDKFSDNVNSMLEKYSKGSLKEEEVAGFKAALIGDLNRIIEDGSIYNDQRFKDINLDKTTKDLLNQKPEGSDLVRLNQMLLNIVFSNELSKKVTSKLEIYEPRLVLTQQTRWLPLEWLTRHNWYKPVKWFPVRSSEIDIMKMQDDLGNFIDSLNEDRLCYCNNAENCDETKKLKCKINDQTKILAKARAEILNFQMFGSNLNMAIPAEILLPQDAKKISLPQPGEIFPDVIKLSRENGMVKSRNGLKLVVTGSELKTINLKTTKILTNSVAFTKTIDDNPRMEGDTIVMTVDVKDATGPIVFELDIDPVKSGLGKPATVRTKPITVTVEEQKPSANDIAVMKSVYKTGDSQDKTIIHTIEMNSKANTELIKATKSVIEAEIQKDKPLSGNSANVSVNVQAPDGPTKK